MTARAPRVVVGVDGTEGSVEALRWAALQHCVGRGFRQGWNLRIPVCGRTDWLEVAGAGMVDPNVFANVGYDPERWTGFAFGFGLDRIAMIRHQISDIRLLYEGDLRFLEQFS